MNTTVSEDAMYFYIMQGESDDTCYVQRKCALKLSDNPFDSEMPEAVITGLCKEVLSLKSELEKYKRKENEKN